MSMSKLSACVLYNVCSDSVDGCLLRFCLRKDTRSQFDRIVDPLINRHARLAVEVRVGRSHPNFRR